MNIIRWVGLMMVAVGLIWGSDRVGSPKTATGQSDSYQNYLIYNGAISIVNISWANDNQTISYQIYTQIPNDRPFIGVHTNGYNSWRQYSVVTQQTAESDYWPFQPDLTPTQYADFEIVYSPEVSSFVFESPNHRYIVYSATGVGEGETPLGIADLQTDQYRIFDFARLDSEDVSSSLFSNFALGQVYWSADSSAFGMTVMVPSGEIRIYHISQLSNLNNVEVRELHTSIHPPDAPDGPSYLSPNVLSGIDATGSRVLLYGHGDGISPLVIWDVPTASYIEIPVNGGVAGSTFVDKDGVLFVDGRGLKRFDIASGGVTLLNSDITSAWGDGGVFFSPDGQYLAVFDYGQGGRDSLYVIPIVPPSVTSAMQR